MSNIEYPKPSGLFVNPSFSQVVVATGSRMIFTAGQVSIDEQGALVGADDVAEQTAQAMRNGLALKAAGAGFGDVAEDYDIRRNRPLPARASRHRKARVPFFAQQTPPASTLIGVTNFSASGEWLVEIEAVAIA